VAIGCGTAKEEPATREAAAPAGPGMIALADVAGRWKMRTTSETGDTTLVEFEMDATADTTGWTLRIPKRPPQSARVVAVGGDSIVTEVGPFESVLQKGLEVRIRNLYRLRDGKLVGTTTARYGADGADSVRTLPTEGTRAP
jgi:hypothetical protein